MTDEFPDLLINFLSSDNEKIIITEEWYLNQLICGEETVNICCTDFAEPYQCEGFDKEDCDEVMFLFECVNFSSKSLQSMFQKYQCSCNYFLLLTLQ